MYADRFARPEGIKPGSLAIAIALNGGVIAALLLSAPEIGTRIGEKVLKVTNVRLAPPPEQTPPEAKPQPQQRAKPTPERIDTPTPIVAAGPADYVTPILPPVGTGDTIDAAATIIDPPVAPPLFIDAAIDPRFARDFQPDYPAGERRMESEGKVVIRVLIGPDGRVKQAERVAAATDAFWRATERQALSRWRFRPATRDGVAIESWRTMTVRFELQG